ncbi:MAG: carboxypeptidase regulatory-like domain-containing protein, partial [Acidobacteriaceae bacterium]|nr:carboxypeptidase regulatory-like domain-containing protein [Acidobacteriaceae bacterium]
VSESPLLITAVPEGGTLVPNLENQVFILTSYADGKPAKTDVRVGEQRVSTDESGIAVVRVKGGPGAEKLTVEATDHEGNRASTVVNLQTRQDGDQILVRADHAVYRAGDVIRLEVLSTKQRGSAYVDVVKDGQTVLTRDVDIVAGRAELTVPAGPDLAGTLDVNAYVFGSNAIPVADHRLVFVQPAEELKIEASADRATYKPGDEARVRFHVTNAHGEGVQAALGLQVVDEAVFALAEKQPGFAKVFFYLEQEALKPRYEIHSVGTLEAALHRDQAARVLFAATEMVNRNRFQTEVGRNVPMTKYAEYSQRYWKRFETQAQDLAKALSRVYAQSGEGDLTKLAEGLSGGDAALLNDMLGGKMALTKVRWDNTGRYYTLQSSGTRPPLAAILEVHKAAVGKGGATGIDMQVEHDRGAFNGKAEIAGTVVNAAGLAAEGVVVEVRSKDRVRNASVDGSGQFSIAGLTPGDYAVHVGRDAALSKKVTLAARDRAVVKAVVSGGSADAVVVAQRFRVGGMMADFGAVLGGVVGGVPGAGGGALPAPMLRMMAMEGAKFDRAEVAALKSAVPMVGMNTATVVAKAEVEAPRVRSYFPEALFIRPEIVTDADGRASVTIPMADSITTWRMAMIASTKNGALGTGTSSLKVFQDFFADLDLPVTLTQGDRVEIPVAAYNYSGSRGDVHLELQPADWFALVDDAGNKNLTVDGGRVGGSQFRIEAKRIGKFQLTLSARLTGATDRADIVVRDIEVVPNGREQNQVFNGRLETSVHHELQFPPDAIDEASKILVRLYPGPLSQVVEGMDAILRMPFGCFEQTSSATYPNVLALDYMKRTKKITPEVHAKAEGFIANGYQRLLTFEVPGGGFSWFGRAPANKILTSYGLMEFSDMSKVHDVDQKVIERTQHWLSGEQQADGSWKPDNSFINEGATNRYNSDLVRISAYIGWALESSGFQGVAVDKAKQYVQGHMDAKADAYTLAVVANFAADYGKDREFAREAVRRLVDARKEQGDHAWWESEETGMYGRGPSAAVETTGLAVQALLKSGMESGVARKALAYLAAKKDASGTWGTTQATIMALRALLLSMDKGAADVRGTVEVTLNGKPVEKLTLTPDNNDLLHQFVLKAIDSKAANRVDIVFRGTGGLAYQVVGRSYVPWTKEPTDEPLTIAVDYDRTKLAQDDIATATATVRSHLNRAANMVMIDLGIPPGFDVLSEDLQEMQEKTAGQKGGRLEKFNLTATQAILYLDSIAPGQTVTVKYRLRAKYPIRARTFLSKVYEYYAPEVKSVAAPV